MGSRKVAAFSINRVPLLFKTAPRNYASSLPRRSSSVTMDDTIITPRDPLVPYNFARASLRDEVLFTCEQPGGEPESGKIPASAVEEWARFMSQKGISQVMVLLDDNELEAYEDPGLLTLYKKHGFIVHRNPMEVGASTRAMATIASCEAEGQKIVAHCTHGQGRAGRVAAAWLVEKYSLSPEVATEEALAMARAAGITRMGSPSKLSSWLQNR